MDKEKVINSASTRKKGEDFRIKRRELMNKVNYFLMSNFLSKSVPVMSSDTEI